MMKPPNMVWPDFMNLGIARPAPQGATNVAPRVAGKPLYTITNLIRGMPRARSPQPLMAYMMPFAQMTPGTPFLTTLTNNLVPNPYTP